MRGWIPAKLRDLARESSGSVGIVFGILIIPILAVVGGAMDYSEASRQRQKIQVIADAAVLAAAREPMGRGEAIGLRNFQQQLQRQLTQLDVPQVQIADAGEEVRLHFGAGVPTRFMAIVGWNAVRIEVRSTARREINAALNPCAQAVAQGLQLVGRRGPNGRITQAQACEVNERRRAQGLNPYGNCRPIDLEACRADARHQVRLVD